MNDQLILKNRIKEARTERKLSQAALAELVGVSRNTISSIETGQFSPTAKLALILCIALDKTFEELFYLYTRRDTPPEVSVRRSRKYVDTPGGVSLHFFYEKGLALSKYSC